MSKIIFTNNIGTIEMEGIMYDINDSFFWDGVDGSSRVITSISVEATVTNIQAGNIKNVLSNIVLRGGRGTLQLPHKTYSDTKIDSITQDSETWTPYGKMVMSFSNDSESGNTIATIANGEDSITIYEPALSIDPSKIRISEKAIANYNGDFKQQNGLDFIKISFSGIVIHDSCEFPTHVLNCIEQIGENGLPLVSDLRDLISGIPDSINYKKVIVEGSSMIWNIEKKFINIKMNLICPPQEVGV